MQSRNYQATCWRHGSQPACVGVPAAGQSGASVRPRSDTRSDRWAPWARPAPDVNVFPERRPCRRAGVGVMRVVIRRCSFRGLLIVLLSTLCDEVAVKIELADQGIDLPQADGWLRVALQIAAHEAVIVNLEFQS